MPIIAGIMGFIFIAIGTFVYNFLASMVGGIEFELVEVNSNDNYDADE